MMMILAPLALQYKSGSTVLEVEHLEGLALAQRVVPLEAEDDFLSQSH